MCEFCIVWVCVGVGFMMCGCVYVWVLYCVGMCRCGFYDVWVCVCVGFVMCMYGFCNVWVCVCVGFMMCGCSGNMCNCIYYVFVLFRLCIFILIVTSVRTTATERKLSCCK